MSHRVFPKSSVVNGRRKALRIGVIGALVALMFSSGVAHADRVGGGAGQGNDTVEIGGERDGSPGATTGPRNNGGGGGPRPPVPTTAAPTYDQCLDLSPSNPLYQSCINEFSVGTNELFPQNPQQPAVDPQVQAQQLAENYFRRIQLPVPRPVMSAPSGITGAVHQMNMQIPATISLVEGGTAFGDLEVSARGRFVVDWGDGTTDSYLVTGASWPASPITHSWTKRGNYTVVVTAHWEANWRLGGFSGVVGNLTTTGSIPAFEVGEIQATVS